FIQAEKGEGKSNQPGAIEGANPQGARRLRGDGQGNGNHVSIGHSPHLALQCGHLLKLVDTAEVADGNARIGWGLGHGGSSVESRHYTRLLLPAAMPPPARRSVEVRMEAQSGGSIGSASGGSRRKSSRVISCTASRMASSVVGSTVITKGKSCLFSQGSCR